MMMIVSSSDYMFGSYLANDHKNDDQLTKDIFRYYVTKGKIKLKSIVSFENDIKDRGLFWNI